MRFTRGFHGRQRVDAEAARVPPGQYVTRGFPVLSAGPTPHPPLADWTFTIRGELDAPLSWTWEELRALPSETVTVDIHCVTKWSKLETTWSGVSLDTLLDGVETAAEHVLVFCDGGYTTNLPLEDLMGGGAWVAYEYEGEPLDPVHGGPARLLYSARSLSDVVYRDELTQLATDGGIDIRITLTREQPDGWRGYRRRIDEDLLAEAAWPAAERPLVYVCGPTGFVETAAAALVTLGHDPARIRLERFDGTGS